ncbi:MAG: hypothetical protein ACK54F_03645 [Planctomycetia bacterium]|jgi:hypothetical protein
MKQTPLKRKTPLKAKSKKLLSIIKGNDPTIIDKLKEKGLVKKASTLTTKRKATGEKEVFREVWEERPHNCEICGVFIKEARAINFSHALPKGKFPEYRLDKRNIFLKCEECHQRWHTWGKELRTSSKWGKFFTRYDNLYEEAYQKK